MIKQYLKISLESLDNLIEMTKIDIEDIKAAEHAKLFERLKAKEEMMASFETYKNLIDFEISRRLEQNPGADLNTVLTESEQQLLDIMKQQLMELKKVNKHYAKIVIAVSSFYNSLLENFIPSSMQEGRTSYEPATIRQASFLEIKG